MSAYAPKGYRTITVQQKIYDYLMDEYKPQKDGLATKKGIKNFSAYVTWRLAQLIEQDKKRSP